MTLQGGKVASSRFIEIPLQSLHFSTAMKFSLSVNFLKFSTTCRLQLYTEIATKSCTIIMQAQLASKIC